MASDVVVQPQVVLVGSVSWAMSEISSLQSLFNGNPTVTMGKRDIRRSALIQKALLCEAVVNQTVQVGDTAVLYLSQVGLDLIGTL